MGIPSNKNSNSSKSNSNSNSNSTHTTPTPTAENETESSTLPSPSPSQSPSSSSPSTSSHSLSPYQSQSQLTISSNQFTSINDSSNTSLELSKIHKDYKKFNSFFTKCQSIDNINELNKLINKKFNLNLAKDPTDENLIIIQPKSKKKLLSPNSTGISQSQHPPPTILFNETPFIEIPSFEFLKLIELGRCCSNCSDVLKLDKGRLANPESQKSASNNNNNNNSNNNPEYSEEVTARYMNGLDCDICNLKWCSIECKQMDIFHTLLNHQPTNKSFINSILNTNKQKINLKYNNWLILKKFIITNNLSSIFSVFILILWFNYDINLFNLFNSLKSIEIDDIIDKENHLINYLKTLNNMNRTNRIINNNNNINNNINDEENNKILIEDDDSTELNEEIYSKSYELICDCLPNCPFELNYLQFLRILIKFKLNNFNGSLFLFASHLKHSCEPNCSIDFIEEDKEINDSSVSDNSYYFLSINNLLNSAVFSRQTTLFPQLIPQIKTTEDTDDHEKNKNNNNQFKQPKYLVTNKNYVQVFSNNNKSNANKNNDNNTSKNNGKKQNNKKSKEIKHLSAWNSTAQGIQLKLLKTIDKNETLTINYLENPPLDVNERRLEILKKFNFWCDCPLCNRQSELESDNSNITNNKNNSVSIFNNKSLMMSSMQPKPSTSPQNLTLHSHPRTRRVSITSMTSTNSANSQDKQSLILQQPLSDKENLTLSLPGISSNKKRQNSISSLNQANSNNSNNDNILSNADMNSYSLSNFNISSNEDQEHRQQQSQPYSSILPVPTQQTRKPSFTSSGGSFGEGILKYSRKQISEMLDNLYIDATNNSNSNNGTTGGSVCNSGVFLDAVIDEEDEDGELELELPVPSNFNRGKRKSVRFDDDNIILN